MKFIANKYVNRKLKNVCDKKRKPTIMGNLSA